MHIANVCLQHCAPFFHLCFLLFLIVLDVPSLCQVTDVVIRVVQSLMACLVVKHWSTVAKAVARRGDLSPFPPSRV